jgi:hypothetical protein
MAVTTDGTFELRITISGLALFRREPNGEPTAMHVYMPKHNMSEHSSIPEHFRRVWYDEAHENPTAPANPGRDRKMQNLAALVDFRQLSVVGGSLEHLPHSVPCIVHATGRNCDPDPSKVGSHLVLPPGTPEIILATSIWKWRQEKGGEEKAQHLAGLVVWSVTVSGSQLPAIPPLPVLYPKDGVIDLFVSNALAALSTFPPGVGPRPARGTPMVHFDAYYDLCGQPAEGRQYPIYQSNLAASAPYGCLSSGGH